MSKREKTKQYHLKYCDTGEVESFLTVAELQQLVAKGQIKATDRVRKEGHRTWHLASTVIGLQFHDESNDYSSTESEFVSVSKQTTHGSLTSSFLASRGLSDVSVEEVEETQTVHTQQKRKNLNRIIFAISLCLIACVVGISIKVGVNRASKNSNTIATPRVTTVAIQENSNAIQVDETVEERDDGVVKEVVEKPLVGVVEEVVEKLIVGVVEEVVEKPVVGVVEELTDAATDELANKTTELPMISLRPQLPPGLKRLISFRVRHVEKYVIIQLTGEVGIIPKDINGKYTTEFISANSLRKLLKALDKKKTINGIAFLIDSSGGDMNELKQLELLFSEFDERFVYHAAVINAGSISGTIQKFCDSKFDISDYNEISNNLNPPEFIEDETKSEWCNKYLITMNKRLIKPLEEEIELAWIIMNTLEGATSVLSGICNRVSAAEDMHPNNYYENYEKEMETYPCDLDADGRIEEGEYCWRETNRLSSLGRRQWNTQARSASQIWSTILEDGNNIDTTIAQLRKRWSRKMKVDCETFTHREIRTDLEEKLKSKDSTFKIIFMKANSCATKARGQIDSMLFY